MGTKILVVNIGSASKKYSLFDATHELAFFHFEQEEGGYIVTIKKENGFEKESVSSEDYSNSVEFLSNYLSENMNIQSDDIVSVAFRIVAPGTYFQKDRIIDAEFIDNIEKAEKFDELHISPVIKEIKKVSKMYIDQKIIGVSDSAFHNTKKEESKYYGISKKLQDTYDYRRFGYHGISVESVIEKIKEESSVENKKIIVCHLGGGISITAINNGISLDNTMGFSPLEGPVMATRSGSVDEVLLLDLFKEEKILSDNEKIEFLFEKSGLLGLSGISDDLRILRDESFKGNSDAKFALKVYVFNIVKSISEMVSVSKGVDMIVFTGTIGLRAGFLRELILEELQWLGFYFDMEKNSDNSINSDYFKIHSDDSKKEILVCGTDEMKMILKRTMRFV